MNGPWINLYEHNFVDTDLSNNRGAPGAVTSPTSFAPLIRLNDPTDQASGHHAHFTGNEYFFYAFDSPVVGVVAYRLQCRFRLDPTHDYPDDGQTHTVAGKPYSIFTAEGNPQDFGLSIRNQELELMWARRDTETSGFDLKKGEWRTARWEWNATGRSALSVDGKPAAFRNDLHPNTAATINQIAVGTGFVGNQAPASQAMFVGDIAHIGLWAMTYESLDPVRVDPLSNPDEQAELDACIATNTEHHQALFAAVTGLFNRFLTEHTAAGNPGTFDKEALNAHKHAQGFSRSYRTWTVSYADSDRDAAVKHFKKLMKLLAHFDKDSCRELITMARAVEVPTARCRQLAQKLTDRPDVRIQIDLFEELAKVLEEVTA